MAPMFRPLRERNYRLWTAADIVSVSGTWMQVLGLNWLVLAITGSATVSAHVIPRGLAQVIPQVVGPRV